MNIVIPTTGTRGDVQPFFALAQGLARAGHTVTILSHPVMRLLVESHGVTFSPVGPAFDMDEVSAPVSSFPIDSHPHPASCAVQRLRSGACFGESGNRQYLHLPG